MNTFKITRIAVFAIVTAAGFVQVASAQTDRQVKVEGGTDIGQMVAGSRWVFPKFEQAEVFMKSARSKAMMNYDMLSNRMFFIDSKNDTLALANNDQVVIIRFDKRYFKPFDKGYIEIIGRGKGDTELWLRQEIRKTDTQKTGAYGLPSSTAATTDYGMVSSGGTNENLSIVEWSQLKMDRFFYLSANGKVRKANEKGFLKIFAPRKAQITDYLKQQPVDFDKGDDVVRLFEFCTKE